MNTKLLKTSIVALILLFLSSEKFASFFEVYLLDAPVIINNPFDKERKTLNVGGNQATNNEIA